MVAKCANPPCPARFRCLSQGKLLRLEVDYGKYEYFWLCADCAPKMSLKVEWGKGVVAVPAPAGPEPHWPACMARVPADYRDVVGQGARAVSACLKRKGEPRVTLVTAC